MNSPRYLIAVFCTVFAVACFLTPASAQTADDKNKIATMSSSVTTVRWDVLTQNSGMTLTIAAPDGQVFRKEFAAGTAAEFRLTDSAERLPDGVYIYELRLTPVISPTVKEMLSAARAKGKDEEIASDLRKRGLLPSQLLVQSGSFSVLNGAIIVAGALEEGESRPARGAIGQVRVLPPGTGTALTRLQQHHARLNAMPAFLIADDLVVQGSVCSGLDCVNGEVFGFDTIRLKENNTRLQFDDTSASAGFATNNWQIRANNSASGGGSFLAFVDQGATGNSETGTIVFEVDAGAPANSLRVSSLGKVGVRTATPVLDVHANTTDTPAIRLEQNNSGGFTAQTWDIGGNEANFFIRDVPSGSLLPFRIRPGAPTSSLDIAATGNVGIGTGSPTKKLHVASSNSQIFIDRPLSSAGNYALVNFATNGVQKFFFGMNSDSDPGVDKLSFFDSGFSQTIPRMTFTGGNIGIGTKTPTDLLTVNGNASKPGGGSWSVFSDERLKIIKGRFSSGLKAVMQLQPLRFEYKLENAMGIESKGEHVGFGAQSLQQIIPEAVSRNANGYLVVNNDPILWTMLNAIKEQQNAILEQQNAIKEQQQEIKQLKSEVNRLRRSTRTR